MDDPFELRRFVDVQNADGTYLRALDELRAGRKQTHWMWFVFPQLAGLGTSPTAQRFALSGLAEARAYLAHGELSARLAACTQALLKLDAGDPVAVLGPVDAAKLRSSMTLFTLAAPGDRSFRRVLEQYFDGARDPATLALLAPDTRAARD